MQYLTLEIVKKHLSVEASFTEDDAYIEVLCDVAEAKVARELDVEVSALATIGGGNELPKPLLQAMLLTVAHYYASREDAGAAISRPIEQGSIWLIQLYRQSLI